MRPHDGRAIPTFLRQALTDRPITVFGDGSQTRSFCYVDDLIRGHDRAGRVRPPPAGQHRQPERVHAARAGRDGHRGHRLEVGDRLRGAADRRPARCASPTSRWPASCSAGSPRSSCARACSARSTRPGVDALVGAGAADLRRNCAVSGATSAAARSMASAKQAAMATLAASDRSRPRRAAPARPRRRRCATTPVRARHAAQAPAGAVASCCALDTLRRAGARRLAAGARLRRRSSLAIFTALALKAAVARRPATLDVVLPADRRTTCPFAYLVTALLFARSGLYADRAAAPGPDADRRLAVPGDARALLIFAVVNGKEFSSYYIFYGSLFFAVVYVSTLPLRSTSGSTGRAAARRRLPAPRGARRHAASTSRPSPTRCGDAPALADRRRRLRLADAAARQRAALARHARGAADERARPHRIDEVIIADPDFPAAAGRRARRPVPPARRARADRAVDDGDPRPPRRVRARPVGAAVRAQAAGLRGLRLRAQAHLRPRRSRRCCCSCSARCCAPARSRSGSPRAGPVLYRSIAARHRRRSRSPA